jgi:ATP-dependent helicase/nuclease subunit B
VRALQANQLALGLAMAAAGALVKNGEPLAPGTPIAIEYWQLQGARAAAGTVHTPLDGKEPIDAAAHAAAAVAHAGERAAHYLLAQNPFEPKLRPEWAWGDYDHLARVPEWINRPRTSAGPKA